MSTRHSSRLRFLCLLGLLGLEACAPAVASGRGFTPPPAEVEAYLREQMRLNHIPSLSLAVVRNGATEYLASYGTANLEWEVGSTVSTAYQLASATKPITGTALMLLVQEGTLELDGSVTRYLPGAPPEWAPITLRHLMAHSSGIPDDPGPGAPRDAQEAVERLVAKPLVFEPGTRTSYGIGGYVVAQRIIERVSGMSFPEFLAQRLAGPLGMVNTRFDNSSNDGPFRIADVVPRRAGIYQWQEGVQRIFWFHFGAEAYTAGGLLSSVEDLARWAAALDTGRILSVESQRVMLSGPTGEAASGFGVGWALGRYRGRRTVGHSGGPALADILRFPDEKLTIVVLANQAQMYPYLAQGVADILLPAPTRPAAEPISDAEPELTDRVRAFLTSAAQGAIQEDAFTESVRGELVGQLRGILLPYARSLGPPTEVLLLEERLQGDLRVRDYRILYGKKSIRWRFDFAPDGRIASLIPTPE